MKFITLMAALVISTSAMAQDLTAAAAIEADTVEASVSTPGNLNSQRIRGAAAINAGCVTTETYDTTVEVVEDIAEECEAELVVADPAPEINEVKASTQPTENYPVKE